VSQLQIDAPANRGAPIVSAKRQITILIHFSKDEWQGRGKERSARCPGVGRFNSSLSAYANLSGTETTNVTKAGLKPIVRAYLSILTIPFRGK
jgi:hypothetical protein